MQVFITDNLVGIYPMQRDTCHFGFQLSYAILRLMLKSETGRLKVGSFDLNAFDTVLLNLAEFEL